MSISSNKIVVAGLLALTLLGLGLRALVAWPLPLVGDEVGTWIYMAKDVRFILTHIIDPWLSMPVFIAGTRAVYLLLGDHPFVLRLPVMLAGALAIPFAAGVIKRLGGRPSTMLIGAAGMALHPYLIHFGTNLRAYSIVVLTTLAALYFVLRWLEKPSWSTGWGFALSATVAMLAHFCANYYMAFLAVFFVLRYQALYGFTQPMKTTLNRLASLAVPLALTLPVVVVFYLGIWPDMLAYREVWGGIAPTPVNYIAELTGSFLGHGWLALPGLVLLLGSWIYAVRTAPTRALLVGLGVAIPIFLYSASGSQSYPWANTRYMIYLLPLLIIEISFGLEQLRRWPGARALGLALLLVAWWPDFKALPVEAQREPWRAAHAYVRGQIQPDDVVLASGHEYLHLVPGFKKDLHRLQYFRDYLPGPTNQNEAGLFVVTINAPLASAQTTQRLGSIFIHYYRGPDRVHVAQQVVEDIRLFFGGQAKPEQAALAEDCLNLMRALHASPQDLLDMERVYYHSFIRSDRGQFMHDKLRAMRFP